MNKSSLRLLFLTRILLTAVLPAHAAEQATSGADRRDGGNFAELSAAVPTRRTWQVDGVEREALFYAPPTAQTQPAPLVFLFHGRNSRMDLAASRYELHRRWPEAIVVCPQGLILAAPKNAQDVRTVHEIIEGPDAHPDGKGPTDYGTGWQMHPGQDDDRDLKFFDVVLASLRRDYRVDDRRIYAAGHSNGAMFTYLLWAKRGDMLAAVAPTAGTIVPSIQPLLRPLPVFLVAGEKDKLVKIEWQTASIDFIRKLDGCGEGKRVSEDRTLYPSVTGTPLVTIVHHGGHSFPREAADPLVAFLREQVKPGAPATGR